MWQNSLNFEVKILLYEFGGKVSGNIFKTRKELSGLHISVFLVAFLQ